MTLYCLTHSHSNGIDSYLFLSNVPLDDEFVAERLGVDYEAGEDLLVAPVQNVNVTHQDPQMLAELGIPTL